MRERLEALEKSLAATIDDRTVSVGIDVERLHRYVREVVDDCP